METAFQNEAAGDILVQGPGVQLGLGSTCEFSKVPKGMLPVELGRGLPGIIGRRHNVSSYEAYVVARPTEAIRKQQPAVFG